MRTLLTLMGIAAIVTYSVLGMMLMNDWAVVAASGFPLDRTIADMEARGELYTAIPGFGFAASGIALALVWGLVTIFRPLAMPVWATVLLWAGILALGAPAYFFTAFSNLNSVGDTYYEWNAEAAFALESPLYGASMIAFVVALGSAAVALAMSAVRRKPSARWL
ncbi:hypothetical protein ACSYDW_14185 [Paeniglutamicibacter sp. R2-26]|uniref:hypothetical protein n=1 Tax=Paeniglutamicibacter sp. R2-26 TaxID=3144417 RepID=UPI003EE5E3BD